MTKPELLALLSELQGAFGSWNDLTHEEWDSIYNRLGFAMESLMRDIENDKDAFRRGADAMRESVLKLLECRTSPCFCDPRNQSIPYLPYPEDK